MHTKVSMVRDALSAYAAGDTACEHRAEGQSCGACEGCDARRFSDALAAFDGLMCDVAGGLAAGQRAAQTAKELTSELLRAERALEHEDREGMGIGEAAEHLAWQYHEACESEQALLKMVRSDNERVAHQQAIHEQEMEQDGRARAMMVALCRDLGVSIYTDARRCCTAASTGGARTTLGGWCSRTYADSSACRSMSRFLFNRG